MFAKTCIAAIVAVTFISSAIAQESQPSGKINFEFREAKWIDVLTWFAGEADRALQVNEAPTGDFTYSDSKDYTPAEAIDLLNGVLIAKGFTLIRRDRLLICVNLAKQVPEDLIPESTVEDLTKFGTFEMVRVTFDLGAKPAAEVKTEIEPLLGQYGSAVPLPKTKKIIVTASASQMRAVAATIASMPVPKTVVPPIPPKKQKPELKSYDLESIDPKATQEMISKLVSGITLVVDEKVSRINANATPDQHVVIDKIIKQLQEDAGPEKKAYLETYAISAENIPRVVEQLSLIVPSATISADEDGNRLLIFAQKEDHESIVQNLTKLQAIDDIDFQQDVLVVTVENADPAVIAESMNNLFARSKISTTVIGNKIAIRAPPETQKLIATIVERLDETAVPKPAVHFQDLEEPFTAEELAAIKLIAPQATITMQQEGRRLMVSAMEADWKAVQELVKQIEHLRPQADKRQIQSYEISTDDRVRFLSLYKKVNQELEKVEIVEQNNPTSLTILATEQEHTIIAALIAEIKLKFQSPATTLQFYATTLSQKERFLKLYKQLREDLQKIQIIDQNESRELVIRATETEHEAIRAFLEELTTKFAEPKRQLLSYTVPERLRTAFDSNRENLAPQLNRIKILNSSGKDKLVVLATGTEHAELTALLETLSKTLPEEKVEKLKLYPVSPEIRQRFAAIQTSATSDLKSIRIVDGTQANELVIWALPETHVQIADVLEQLRKESPIDENQVVVYPIKNGDLDSIMSILNELHPDKKIISNSKSQQILVWADAANQKMIKTAIEQMDVPASEKTSTKMAYYKMGEIDSRDIESFLNNLLPDMTIQSERDTNSIIAWGSEKDHQLLKETINQLKQEQTKREVSVYPTGIRDPFDLRRLLQQIVPNANIVSDSDANMIAAWATAEEHAAIKTAMEKLTKDDSAVGKMVVYLTPNTDADQVILMLEKVAPQARFADADADTKVIAWASEEEHQQIDALVKQIEAGDPQLKNRVTQTYDINQKMSERIVTLIADIAPKAKAILGEHEKTVTVWAVEEDQQLIGTLLKAVVKDASSEKKLAGYEIASDMADEFQTILASQVSETTTSFYSSDAKQLFVWATDDDHKKIGAIASKWSTAIEAIPLPDVRIYPVKGMDPSVVVSALPDKLTQEASITQNDERQALIVRAVPEKHAEIKAAIDEILSALPAAKERQVAVYPVKNSDPSAAITTLTQLLPNATFAVENQTKSVIATAFPNEHLQIKKIIDQIDSGKKTDTATVVYSLKTASPAVAQTVVSTLLPNVTTSIDTPSKTLVAIASADEHEQIKTIVEQMDSAKAKMTTVVYRLQTGDPAAAQTTCQTLLPNATIVIDANSKSLVATASLDDHAQIKSVVDQLDSTAISMSTVVYRLAIGDPSAAKTACQTLVPKATTVVDLPTKSLVATASAEDHVQIKTLIDQLDSVRPSLTTVVYPMQGSDPAAAQSTLQSLIPNATSFVDSSSKSLIATASAEEHRQIQALVDQMQAAKVSTSTIVYKLNNGDPTAAHEALQSMIPNATFVPDRTAKAIIATAAPEDHAKIKTLLDQINLSSDTKSTVVYRFKLGDPIAAQTVLRTLVPNATTAVDAATGSLIATAVQEEHQQIKATIDQMDKTNDRARTLEAYVLRNSDANAAFTTLRQAFERNPNVSISLDQNNGAIMATASPLDHKTIATIIARMESALREQPNRSLEIYPLGEVDSARVLPGLQSLLADSLPKADLSIDGFSNQLYAVATQEQHALLKNSLSRLTSEKSTLEVFQLRSVDPFVIEQAIGRVFEDSSNAPLVSSDIDTQQLIVRGNQQQIQTIRDLLIKMGETGFEDRPDKNSRTIRFRSGNIDQAILQLQQVWPKLRKNRIEVLRTKVVEEIKTKSADKKEADPTTGDGEEGSAEIPNCGDEPHAETNESDDRPDPAEIQTVADSKDEDAVAPVVIVPGPNSVTISSDDKEALQQAYELLDTLAQTSAQGGAGNFAVYPLRNAGAQQIAKILNDLFEQMPESTQGSLGRVSLVPDPRLNAIVAHGRPTDRNVLGELLDVLDSDYVDDSLAATKAQIIPVKNTDANRVLTILKTIYKTQLSSGGDRPEISIPEGVSSDVASVLEQINAATSGPVLTLEVDKITNSIVMMAPTQLGVQVTALVKRLDESSEKLDSRTVKLIRLKDTNARQIQKTLQELITKP